MLSTRDYREGRLVLVFKVVVQEVPKPLADRLVLSGRRDTNLPLPLLADVGTDVRAVLGISAAHNCIPHLDFETFKDWRRAVFCNVRTFIEWQFRNYSVEPNQENGADTSNVGFMAPTNQKSALQKTAHARSSAFDTVTASDLLREALEEWFERQAEQGELPPEALDDLDDDLAANAGGEQEAEA
jgi:hypothetical protein